MHIFSIAVVVVGSVAIILNRSVILVVLLVGGSVGHIGSTMSNIPGILVQKSSWLASSYIASTSNSWKFLVIPLSLVFRVQISISSMAVAEGIRSNITSNVGSVSVVLGKSVVVIVLVPKS